jgi:hypothetical protein
LRRSRRLLRALKELIPIAGYANRIVTIKFPELSEEGDQVFVVLRNPKTVALSKLEAQQVATNPDGTPVETEAAAAGYSLLARLILGGHLYDATVDDVDENGFPVDQPLLTYPMSMEKAKTLPVEVINRIFAHIQEAQNPR